MSTQSQSQSQSQSNGASTVPASSAPPTTTTSVAGPPPQPNTFQELQDLLFPSSESLVLAARRIASLQSISLTLTHKSRNTPGLTPAQYRGCVVLTCLSVDGCSFEWKGYGPVDGGWKMRPLQLPTLKKHTVTSWCLCNHPKVPLRIPMIPVLSDWTELVKTRFDYPDDFIECATRLANANNVSVYLLALNLADGKPKRNGRGEATYIPRGFLTLSCVESENGCPFEIKAREEEDGWYLRPWREKGKETKGAVSHLVCKHTAEARAAYELKKLQKKSKGTKTEQQDGSLSHHHQHHAQDEFVDPAFNSNNTLSPSQILGQIEGMHYVPHSSNQHQHHYQPIASTSNAILPHSFDLMRNSFVPYQTIGQQQQQQQHLSSPQQQQQHQQQHPSHHHSSPPLSSSLNSNLANGKRSTNGTGPDESRLKKPRSSRGSTGTNSAAQVALRSTWNTFLAKLDPMGRLSVMEAALVEGGIDPKAVMEWPEADRNAFIEAVAGDIPVGIRMHFRIQLGKLGDGPWEDEP